MSTHRVAACDLILEYTLSAAAVAKGFTAYLAQFIGVELTKLRLQVREGEGRAQAANECISRVGDKQEGRPCRYNVVCSRSAAQHRQCLVPTDPHNIG
jgi:hypothetical protein